jgi:pilus assembly protein CpaB
VESITSSKLFTTRQGTVLLGVIAAVVAAIALLVYLNHYRNSNSGGGFVRVLVAERVIQKGTPGEVIRTTNGLFAPRNIPKSSAETGALTDPGSLAGKVALTDIGPGQELTSSDFGPASSGIVSTLKRTQGAVTLNLQSQNQVGGQLTAGSHVDVYVAFNGSGSNGVSRPIVKEVFQNMTVLQAASSGGNVTLAATSNQAGALIYAAENATVYLVLRPAVASTNAKPPVISVNSLLSGRSLRIGG